MKLVHSRNVNPRCARTLPCVPPARASTTVSWEQTDRRTDSSAPYPTYFPIRLTPPPPSHSSLQQWDAQMGNNSRGVTFINSVLISRAVINIVALVISSVLITRLLFCSATGSSSRVGSSNFQPQAKPCSDLVCFEVRVLQFSGKLDEFCRSMTV